MDTWVKIITDVGFPIAMVLLLIYLIYKVAVDFKGELNRLWDSNNDHWDSVQDKLSSMGADLEIMEKELEAIIAKENSKKEEK